MIKQIFFSQKRDVDIGQNPRIDADSKFRDPHLSELDHQRALRAATKRPSELITSVLTSQMLKLLTIAG